VADPESYQASYDLLAIAERLERVWDGVTAAELHLVAYVACLLAIYRKRPASDWGYAFIRSPWGAPFSPDLEASCNALRVGGFLDARTDVLTTTPSGRDFLAFLSGGSQHGWRTQFLDGACSSALAVPAGAMRNAVQEEPSLRRSSVHRQPRPLLTAGDTVALYEQFGVLAEVVGTDVSDLMVPSVVWLTYLSEAKRLEEQRLALAETGSLESRHRVD